MTWQLFSGSHIHSYFTTLGHGGPSLISDQLKVRSTSLKTQTYLTKKHIIHSHIHKQDEAEDKDGCEGQMVPSEHFSLEFHETRVRKEPKETFPERESKWSPLPEMNIRLT